MKGFKVLKKRKLMRLLKLFLFIILSFFVVELSAAVFIPGGVAAGVDASVQLPVSDSYLSSSYDITDPNISNVEKLITVIFKLTFLIGVFLGSFMFLAGIKKLLENSKNPNDPRNSLGSVVVLLLGASLLFSLQDSIGIATNTLLGNEGFCFNYADKINVSATSLKFKNEGASCFDAGNSDITKTMIDKLDSEGNTKAIEELKNKITILFSVMQVIGLIYFIKGIYMLKSIAEGTGGQQLTYGKALLVIIFSSLAIDLPNTLDILLEEAKKMSAVS